MKKSLFLVPLCAWALASCTSDTPVIDEDNYNGPLETSYLAVHISTSGVYGTRGSDGTTDDYEDGEGNENTVNSVRFYFFDAFNKAANVSNATGSLVNYLDWENPTVTDPSNSENGNIEKELETTLIINTPEGDKVPASVVAVLNPTEDLKRATIGSLDDLNAYTQDFATTSAGSFVMSNSVYGENGRVMEAVDVTPYISTSEEAAEGNPAPIYVERVNAKVRLTIAPQLIGKETTKTDSEGNYLFDTSVENNSIADAEPIYVKFLGWNVTCTTNKSNLMKEIDPDWTNTGLFGTDEWNWSSVTRHRSFWAINPSLTYAATGGNYQFGNFTEAGAITDFGIEEDEDAQNYTYIQENAGVSADDPTTAYPTKVIIAAILTDDEGNALDLAEWAGNYYTQANLLNVLANLANVYQVTEETTTGDQGEVKQYHWTKLNGTYFQFVAAEDLGLASFSEDGRYLAYIQLDRTKVSGMDLVTNTTSTEGLDFDTIDETLTTTVTPAKVWNDGMTYYYFDIEHLGEIEEDGTTYPASYGVVRNHVYAANITAISGLGTPVFDAEDTIVPERPEDNITMISAQIKILSWRLVNKDIQISW